MKHTSISEGKGRRDSELSFRCFGGAEPGWQAGTFIIVLDRAIDLSSTYPPPLLAPTELVLGVESLERWIPTTPSLN